MSAYPTTRCTDSQTTPAPSTIIDSIGFPVLHQWLSLRQPSSHTWFSLCLNNCYIWFTWFYSYLDKSTFNITLSLRSAHFSHLPWEDLHFPWSVFTLPSWALHNPKTQATSLASVITQCAVQDGSNCALPSSKIHPVILAIENAQCIVYAKPLPRLNCA